MKKKKQQIKTGSFRFGLWFFFHSKFLTFCCVFGCLAPEGLGGKGSFFNYTVPRKSDIKRKESQTHASSHPSSHDDDAKREREQKEEERKHEFCRRQAHFRSKHVLGVRQQEGKEEEEECHRFFSASKDAKEEFNRLC
jgi:hypothetical protein